MIRAYVNTPATAKIAITELQKCNQGLPENIKIYFNLIKIDHVRAKTVKTRHVRARMQGTCK